jgi:putative cell wall-binding protein
LHERALPNPWRLALVLGLAFALAVSAVLVPNPVRGGAAGQKVAIIVGPVGGGSIQSNYLNRGEQIAQTVEQRGGTAVRVFSPNATWANVLAAVNGANVIVYIGHGSGYPNPYSSTLQTAWNNGWGLNRVAGVDSADPTGHGHNLSTQMIYCGEAAIEGKPKPSSVSWSQWCAGGPIHPAPGFVMVFSNACYAPGAGETESTTPTGEALARTRVEYFSRPYLALGGTYFASDLGSKSVVEAVLDNPDTAFGDIFRMGNGYSNSAVRGFPHTLSAGMQAWIQRTSGPGGLMSYWYAFGGDPSRTPSGGTASYVPLPPPPPSPIRLFGADRYATAAAISAATFDPGVPAAVVATGATFADALAGAAAAAELGGPLLLVTPTAIPAATAAELARLDPAHIYVLGGPAAVGNAVLTGLGAYTTPTGGAVTRLAGADRYATAAAVSAAVFSPGVSHVFLATGQNYPDGLAAGPAAALVGGPVLLVTPTAIPAATATELARLAPQRIIVVGSTGVISDAVAAALAPFASLGVERVAGLDRYATAAALSARFFSPAVAAAFAATGANFPDALAAGPAAAAWGGPLLLVKGSSLPASAAAEFARLDPGAIFIAGGPGVVGWAVQDSLAPFIVP